MQFTCHHPNNYMLISVLLLKIDIGVLQPSTNHEAHNDVMVSQMILNDLLFVTLTAKNNY